MMLGHGHRPSPTVHVPPWPAYDDPAPVGFVYSPPVTGRGEGDYSPHLLGEAAVTALQRLLPSNDRYLSDDGGDEISADPSLSPPVDAYSCDEFRMYEFKVRRCVRGRSHDWTECPYAHPGEKARRRDPRKFRYSGVSCPDFRKGSCRKGDDCEFAHGVFECWLHPTRYRTQPCKDGDNCRRRVCFFAHSPEQLRAVPPQQQSPRIAAVEETSYDGSPMRLHAAGTYPKGVLSSPASTLNNSPPTSPPTDSPPLSPCGPYVGHASPSLVDVLVSLRRLQLGVARSPPSSWVLQAGCGVGSPQGSTVRSPGFRSLPTTPTRTSPAANRGGLFNAGEGPAERVESGRALRARIYEKLSTVSSMERRREAEEDGGATAAGVAAVTPDVAWVSELVQ